MGRSAATREPASEGVSALGRDRLPTTLRSILKSRRLRRAAVPVAVISLLSIHAGLLAYSATRHSPTIDEPAHLVAGLSYWEFGRFDVYRVNPPLTRLVAALPVMAAGYEMSWNRFFDVPGGRPEFGLGEDFVAANGPRSIWLFTIARWACIPFSIIGGLFCFLWGRELYGVAAGLFSLTLWCFDPNILAHAELITPDAAATSFGIGAGYAFWRWLKKPSWGRAGLAGVLLGIAQLSKMSWLFLFGLWPVLWLFWLASSSNRPLTRSDKRRQAFQLSAVLLMGLYLLNLGYLFQGSLTRVREFTFVSEMLAGEEAAGKGGNRFSEGWLGQLPVPLPKHYLLGFDLQKRDFESFDQPSYLRGEWKQGGWWYYYLYGFVVKIPHGTQLLASLAAIFVAIRSCRGARRSIEATGGVAWWRDGLVLLSPALVLFLLVSSQTEFSHHFRYVLPSIGFLLIFISDTSLLLTNRLRRVGSRPADVKDVSLMKLQPFRGSPFQMLAILPSLFLVASVISSLRTYPHSLAYFNELAGGPCNGHKHMLGSNLDWGQDLLLLRQWLSHQEAGVLDHLLCVCPYDPKTIGFHVGENKAEQNREHAIRWVAVSRGYPPRNHNFHEGATHPYIRGEQGLSLSSNVVETIGYTIDIMRVGNGR